MAIHSGRSIVLAGFIGLFLFSPIVRAYDIHGTIRTAPPYPAIKKIQVNEKYRDACSNEQESQSLIVSGEGLVKNAVVFLEGDFKNEASIAAAGIPVMNQKRCNFTPHILIVRQDQPFRISNSDPIAHDVRSFERAKMLFRFEMDSLAQPVEKKFEQPGIYLLRCGLHPWMHAFVVSAPHSHYAISDEQGKFELLNVPKGKYALKIWHETLGETEVPVEVSSPIPDFSYTFQNH